MKSFLHIASLTLIAVTVAGCGAGQRFKDIGKEPSLSAIDNPTAKPGYRPVQMPMPEPQPVHFNSNSLWRTGSRAFFKDQRASRVGDILTVRVEIDDKAEIDNETTRTRANSEKMGMPNLFGLEKNLPQDMTPSSLVSTDSTASSTGSGSVDREEELETNVAAVVTQVLPNGNMVIEGRQEVRVNFEIRELIVAGIVRPEDIQSDNIIDSKKIAEARIAYGGRGQISDVQQPRYGQQVMDIVLPF
ncbi:flagellar L-ring protein 1 [Terrihabitans soli]|uniref:Flagellar L-ring protein n=1 Tax=Terrihabitans soli TaxID=708113 RepID=A0A6S6QYF0_9HYPH|nr:flagellar basal body L-ring protein FlgH [Terrihabitans soli]BCJ91608.1 flagellar L-ring protein 1 [Terrihabitans soli]